MHSISWPLERAKDSNFRAKLSKGQVIRNRVLEWALLVTMCLLVAVAGSAVSTTTLWLQTLREGFCASNWYFTRPVCETWHSWPPILEFFLYTSLSVLYGTTSALLVKHWSPAASMSGITGLRSYFQGFYVNGLLDPRTLAVRLVGMVLAAASGLWVGQEAPLAHVAVVTNSLLCSKLSLSEARRRDVALAAAATGITIAFSAPLGGVLFAVEVFVIEANLLPQKSVWICFVCAAIATVILRAISSLPNAWGGLLLPETGLFRVSFDRVWHDVELVPFAVLGALGGVYGAIVGRVTAKVRKLYALHPIWATAGVTLVTALLAYASKISRMPAMELLKDLFSECAVDTEQSELCSNKHVLGLTYALVCALVLAPLSFTLPVPSGVLFPSIVVGALGGRLLGLLMASILERLPIMLSTSFCPDEKQHCVTPGVYALVGAASVLSGVTRLTLSAVVLMFETTGALTFIVPIMTGVIVSKWVGDTFGDRRSLYAQWQVEENLPTLPDANLAIQDIEIRNIMTVEVTSTTKPGPVSPCDHTSVPVLGEDGEYRGLIVAKTGAEEPTIVLGLESPLRLAISAMSQLGIRVVVVCENGRFCGLVTRADVINTDTSIKIDIEEFEIDD